MIPYIFVGFIIVQINLAFIKRSKYLILGYIVVFGLLLALSVFRNLSVGTDFLGYKEAFSLIGEHSYSDPVSQEILWKNEYGWYYMNKGIYIIGNFFLYTLCFYFLMYSLIFKTIYEKSSIPLFSVLLYFLCGYYLASFNVMRQAFVFSLFLYSVRFIEDKKFLKYLITLLFGSLFHLSALFLIPIYFITKIKWSKILLSSLLIISLIIGYMNYLPQFAYLIQLQRLQNYLTLFHNNFSVIGYLVFAFNTLMVIIFLMFTKDINSKDSIYLKIVIIGVILGNLVLHYQWLSRFSEVYFIPIMIIAYVNVISQCKIFHNKVIFIGLLILYSLLLFYTTLSNNSNGILPYKLLDF